MEIKGEGAFHLHPTFKARVNNNFFDATEATVDLGQTFRVSNTYQRFVLLFCDNKNNRHILDVYQLSTIRSLRKCRKLATLKVLPDFSRR